MNPKTTIVLVVALVLAVAGVWWAQPPATPVVSDDNAGPQPLLDIKTDDITGYEIKQGDTMTCSFIKENEKWRMTAPHAGPAETFAVNGDIGKITGLQYDQAYAANDPDRPSNEITLLDKPHKIIKLTKKDGKSTVLKIGEGQKLSRKTYVQIEGDDKVYVVNSDLNADLKRKTSDYRGKRVAEFKVGEAVRVQVSGSENFTLAKSGTGWTLEEPVKARADLTLVNKILSTVANLNALEFVADEPKTLRPYGLENPRLTVSIMTEQKTPKPAPEVEGPTSAPVEPEYDVKTSVITLAIGGQAEDRIFAKVTEPASSAVFQVNESVAKDVGVKAADLRDKKIVSAATERAASIKLTSGGDTIDMQRVNADWRIRDAAGGEGTDIAEFAAVDDLLKTVRDMKALGFEETESPDFGLAQPRATLEISIEGELSPLKLAIGGLTPSKTGAYVKNLTDNTIAVIPIATADSIAVKPVSFRSRTILTFDSSNATRLELVRGQETRAVEKSGTEWSMTAPVRGKAEAANITKVLADFSALRGRRVVALAKEAGQFGLNEAAMKVGVTVASPAPAAQSTQPAEAPPPVTHTVLVARHGGLVYAMKADGATICEIDAKVATDLESEWLDTKILSLDPSQIHRLAIEGAESFTFEKQEVNWKLAGEASFAVDPAKITPMLDTLRDLRAKQYVKYAGAAAAEYGLDAPAITIKAAGESGSESGLMISSKGPADGGRYAATLAMPDRVFVLKAEDFAKLSKKVTDFQKAP